MKEKPLNPDLIQCDPQKYGEKYQDHLMEQYKLWLELTDRISQRRQSANTFFLSVNTALVALAGLFIQNAATASRSLWIICIALAGIVLSYSWYQLLRSYRNLNKAKFDVIERIEQLVPIGPYTTEWRILGKGQNKDIYLPFTYIETVVPWIFLGLYITLAMVVVGIYIWDFLYS